MSAVIFAILMIIVIIVQGMIRTSEREKAAETRAANAARKRPLTPAQKETARTLLTEYIEQKASENQPQISEYSVPVMGSLFAQSTEAGQAEEPPVKFRIPAQSAPDGQKSSYFDMGEGYDQTQRKYNLSDAEMFELFHAPAISDAIAMNKQLRFTDNPISAANITSPLGEQWRYIKAQKGWTDDSHLIAKADGTWFAE